MRYARVWSQRKSRPPSRQRLKRRIFVGQSLYAFGALLCVVSPLLSIAFIVPVQLNFAIAPKIPFLSRF